MVQLMDFGSCPCSRHDKVLGMRYLLVLHICALTSWPNAAESAAYSRFLEPALRINDYELSRTSSPGHHLHTFKRLAKKCHNGYHKATEPVPPRGIGKGYHIGRSGGRARSSTYTVVGNLMKEPRSSCVSAPVVRFRARAGHNDRDDSCSALWFRGYLSTLG
jgi:hypothetical protein